MTTLDDFDWRDVQVFLAAMRSKSLRAVAVHLGISHATVGRRLNAFEKGVGLTLFDRRADGLHPRAEAEVLVAAAQDIERAVRTLGLVARAADPELRGTVRVTLPQAFANHLLAADLVAICSRWPELDLQVSPESRVSSLERSEADIAVRCMPHGVDPGDHLVGRNVTTAHRAVYGLNTDAWVGWKGAPSVAGVVPAAPYSDVPSRGSFPGPLLQLAACKHGLGIAWLPCFLGDGVVPRLTQPVPAMDIWVVVHPELRKSPRLRVVRDALVKALCGHENRLKGIAPSTLSLPPEPSTRGDV